MSYSQEQYLGAYIKIPKGLVLEKAVYDWDEKIPEDRFIDAWRERSDDSPSIWLSNYIVDNSIREADEFYEVPVMDNGAVATPIIQKFKKDFAVELALLDNHDIYYYIQYGLVSYVS